MTSMKHTLSHIVYPATMLLGFVSFAALSAAGLPLAVASTLAVGGALLVILLLERVIPYCAGWQPTLRELKTDAVFMLLVQLLLPRGLALVLSLTLAAAISASGAAPQFLWPHESPVWVQLLIMIGMADFLRYWLHVACHKAPLLWRFHAVHHETEKLYALNVARFHPFEKSLQYLFDAAPFVLLAVEPQVIAAYFVFYAINGFFQHANIDVRLGLLNHLISGGELHRWHHHVDPQVAKVNFGNNIILWDTLFGTRYLPGESQGESPVAVGIRDHFNRYHFHRGIVRVWLRHKLLAPCANTLLNLGLKLKMQMIRVRLWKPFLADMKQPQVAQRTVLGKVLRHNRNTRFAKDFGFAHIHNYEEFRHRVPLQNYDSLEPYIRQQQETGAPCATAERPILYAKTSGTTGAAKYIPVGATSLALLKTSQNLAGFCNYRACPEAYQGKLLAIISPAIEGYLPGGAAFGSASGLVVQSMPRLARKKYVLPWEVFDIADHETRYREILKISLCEKNISFLGTANPSTLLMLLGMLNDQRWELLDAIRGRAATTRLPPYVAEAVRKKTVAEETRIEELDALFRNKSTLGFNDLWPGLKLVVTWTGGSCGIPIRTLQRAIDPDTRLMELGYIASECRGTITAAGTSKNGGDSPDQQLPCLQQNFFEFVERSDWEANGEKGSAQYRLLHELDHGHQYYVIVTNFNGLYRYFMNDIVEVDGMFEATPTFSFVQKGKGMTNITGEKLSEQQVMQAVAVCESEFELPARFFLMLADEHRSGYQLLFEAGTEAPAKHSLESELATRLDDALSALNIEYGAKRASGRLGPVEVHLLSTGAGECYRRSLVEAGQRESQLKYLCLQYQRENHFDFGAHYRITPQLTPRLVVGQ